MRAVGCESTHLTVREQSEAARALYAGLGFTEEQITAWLEGAALVDVTYSSAAVPLPVEDQAVGRLHAFVATATRPQ